MKIVLSKRNAINWQDQAEYMLFYLHTAQNYFNEILRIRGYVTLAEVFEWFGIQDPRMPFWGIGWELNDEDGYIDFGLQKLEELARRVYYRKAHVRTLKNGKKIKIKATCWTPKTPKVIVLDLNVPDYIHLPSNKLVINSVPQFNAKDIVKDLLKETK